MFITFEGIDFCGKSTQVRLLKKYFEEHGREVLVIREPGGTEISELVRTILLDKKNLSMKNETEILLFSASRSQLVRELILPSLNQNKIIIADRFFDSTTAYQGYGRGLNLEVVKAINHFAVGDALPFITFFIDIPVEEAEKRKALIKGEKLDRIEVSNSGFFSKVRNGYLEIAKTESRFKIIDGTLPIDTLHKNIINEFEKTIKDMK